MLHIHIEDIVQDSSFLASPHIFFVLDSDSERSTCNSAVPFSELSIYLFLVLSPPLLPTSPSFVFVLPSYWQQGYGIALCVCVGSVDFYSPSLISCCPKFSYLLVLLQLITLLFNSLINHPLCSVSFYPLFTYICPS